jgi:uncharacterized protein YndB with AHSA1/START domain
MFCFAGAGAFAAEVVSVEITRKRKQYFVESETFVEAPVEQVYEVLLDYEHYTRLSSTFKESGYLERNEDGSGIVFTKTEGCILFMCRTMTRVEHLTTVPNREIVLTVIPEQSNLRSGSAAWRFLSEPTGTRLHYRADMEPEFWIPPIIGPLAIRYWLRKGGEATVRRVERAALQRLAKSE